MEQNDKRYAILNNGIKMPFIGLGTGKSCKDPKNIVYDAIKKGIRLIDNASIYENEKEVGESIKKAIDDGIVKREDLFIISKVHPMKRHEVESSLSESLSNLGLTYVDLYLDHCPWAIYKDLNNIERKVSVHELWPKMEEIYKKGQARSIGVSNYNVQNLMNLLSFCEIFPAVNEVEIHPYYTQKGLLSYLKSNNIVAIAYGSLCKGRYVKANQTREINLLEEKVIEEIAQKRKTTPGIISLSYGISQGIVVIPSTNNPERIQENLKSLEVQLDEEEIKLIDRLNENMKFCTFLNPPNNISFDLFT
jgi:diketogulonate reductase-like aldo/keto reductase